MSYFIFGGSGFIGTHLIALIDNLYPGTKIYNLDIVENNHEGKSTQYPDCIFSYPDLNYKLEQ